MCSNQHEDEVEWERIRIECENERRMLFEKYKAIWEGLNEQAQKIQGTHDERLLFFVIGLVEKYKKSEEDKMKPKWCNAFDKMEYEVCYGKRGTPTIKGCRGCRLLKKEYQPKARRPST